MIDVIFTFKFNVEDNMAAETITLPRVGEYVRLKNKNHDVYVVTEIEYPFSDRRECLGGIAIHLMPKE